MSAYEIKRLTAIVLGLVLLPVVLSLGGMTYSIAVECLVLAIAGLAINILLGQTGLVSFGHGAWFGIGAYALGLFQLRLFPESTLIPLLLSIVLVAIVATLIGVLILRRRGVYFSLLTLAFSALCFSVAYRWTSFTGGENGLGGIERLQVFGASLDNSQTFYIFVAIIAFLVAAFLLRLTLSPFGAVLNAIRENEVRTRFVGFDVWSYELLAFILSGTITGLAGALSVLNHRIASGEVMSLIFSGELLAIALIGGMRSFSGPIFGALFYILFREYLSIYTNDWLLYFGLIFIVFILFSPEGLVGVFKRALELVVPAPVTGAAMGARKTDVDPDYFPAFLKSEHRGDLVCQQMTKSFGGIRAVNDVSLTVADRGVHALIGPNGAGKTSLFNLLSGMFTPDKGKLALGNRSLTGYSPDQVCQAGVARSFQITNLFIGLTVRQNLCLSVLARDRYRFSFLRRLDVLRQTQDQTDELVRYLGVEGMDQANAQDLSYGGQRE